MSEELDQPAAVLLKTLRSVLTEVARPSQLLKAILGQAVSQTGADRGAFIEVNRAGAFSYRVLFRFQKEDFAGGAGAFSQSIFKQVLETRRAIRMANAMEDARFATRDSVQHLRLTSILCMPIVVENQVTALVHLEHNAPGHFAQHHQDLLETLAALAGPALGALSAGEGVLREREVLRESRVELEQSREVLAQELSFARFVGRSPVVRALGESVRRAARTDFPVLLIGETGTGKSILARVLHHSSLRAKNAFVTIFCPTLERGMVETELFGHKRGAFTGAVADRTGKIQVAERGTLFLDEVGELPLDIQPKLLRLLQERTYERVGDATERHADVRVIAATNRDLNEEVRAGRFRRDLFERLNFVQIPVPPLRARREDIPLLLRHCLNQHDAGRWVTLTDEAERFLVDLDFAWPGNVRHLEHLAVRLALEEGRTPATPELLQSLLDTSAEGGEPRSEVAAGELEGSLPSLLAAAEKTWIEQAMRRYAHLPRAALAEKLGIAESTLYKKMRQYGIAG